MRDIKIGDIVEVKGIWWKSRYHFSGEIVKTDPLYGRGERHSGSFLILGPLGLLSGKALTRSFELWRELSNLSKFLNHNNYDIYFCLPSEIIQRRKS